MIISLVIPTLNRAVDLSRCLRAIRCQSRPPDEVIVVIGPGDAGSAIVFRDVADGRSGWRAIVPPRASVIEALNLGLVQASGDIIVLTDDDAEAPPFWLQRIEQHFLTDEAVGAVGGRDRLILPEVPELFNPRVAQRVGQVNWYGQMIGNHHCGVVDSPAEVDLLKGVNLSFRRTAFPKREIDPYLIFSGAEVGWELDICLSIRRNRWKLIYDNEVFVDHHVGERLAGDGRTEGATPAALRRAQNVSYMSALHLSTFQAILSLVLALLIGSRLQPGFLRITIGLLAGRAWSFGTAAKLTRATLRGFRDGRKRRAQNVAERRDLRLIAF